MAPSLRIRALLASLLLAALPAAPSAWADPQATSPFVPVQVQDALVVRTGTLTLQGTGVYTRDPRIKTGADLLNLSPTIKVGPLKGVQIDITAPYAVGNQTTASQGSSGVDAYYQFTEPSPTRPALAVQAGYQWPYGQGHKSNQYFVRGLATQWLGGDERAPRLHLNLNFTQVTTPAKGNRRSIPEIGLAYSQLVSDRTALVVDVVHGAKTAVGQNQTFVDAGFKWDVTDAWSLGGGVGVGIGQQSPDARVLFYLTRAFQVF